MFVGAWVGLSQSKLSQAIKNPRGRPIAGNLNGSLFSLPLAIIHLQWPFPLQCASKRLVDS